MKKFLPVLLFVFLLFPIVVFADSCTQAGLGENATKLCQLIVRIANVLFVIGIGLALVVILVGGITIMTAAGTEDKLTKGKKILLYGLIGAAIVVCSGFILELLTEFLAPLL